MKVGSYEIAEFKAAPDGPQGLFAALVSVFGNVDRQGDRVMPGAFQKSIEKWKEADAPIPVIWSHDRMNPDSYVGSVRPQDMQETPKGLVVAGKFDIETNPKAARVFNLLSQNLLKEWSFGYEVKDERIGKDLARELVEVDLIEVGPTLKGANSEVRTLAVKEDSLEEKAVDNSGWDGNRALGECNSASDYRQICAGEHTYGNADERQHWALPHHYLGRGPNADGVRNALARLPQTQQLSNESAARSHLEAHMNQINPGASAEVEGKYDPIITAELAKLDQMIDDKIGRVISAKTEAKIRDALVALEEILSRLGEAPEQASSPPEEKQAPGEKELLLMGLNETELFLHERSR